MRMASPDFRWQKTKLVLWILVTGMTLALGWMAWESLVMDKGYPESYLTGLPAGRFGDFTDVTLVSTLPNPYIDPTSNYSPTAYILLRNLGHSDTLNLIRICFFSLLTLALLLVLMLQPIVKGAWARVSLAFLFLALSYPILFCIDRGNIEILMVAFIGGSIYFFSRHQDVAATALLIPAICLKFYPALFLVLLLRRRKMGLAVLAGAVSLFIIGISFLDFQEPPAMLWHYYRQNIAFFRDLYIYNNPSLEGSASPWNAYKIVLIALERTNLLGPVDFGFSGTFIQNSYRIYAALFALATLVSVGYASFYERKWQRGILMLLLLVSISTPNGGDYRLMYASMALVMLMLFPDRRHGDLTALVLIALAVIPKKQVLLTFVGTTETGCADVPIQAFLNPLLIIAAMSVLLYQSLHPTDWHRVARRIYYLLFSRGRLS